jgi:hypothetical protein
MSFPVHSLDDSGVPRAPQRRQVVRLVSIDKDFDLFDWTFSDDQLHRAKCRANV